MTSVDQRSYGAERARAVIAGGVNSVQRRVTGLEDVVVVGSSRARLRTADGRELLDFHGAYGPPVLGHNDPDVDEAVIRTLRAIDNPGLGVTPPEIELAERITEEIASVERVLFTNTGSEATFQAIRVARTVTGRQKIVKFQGCYHGWHDSVAMNVISPVERVGARDPLSSGILPSVLDATLIAPFNDAEAVEQLLSEHKGEVAAIILELVPHNVGALLPEPGFVQRLRDLADREGIVLIFDEVITGFRHALGGYQEVVGVQPDLTTMGKAFANGYPISALGGSAAVMEQFATVPGRPAFFAGTFNGHPAMAAAAVATIDKLRNEPVHEHLYALGDRAREGLRAVFADLGVEAVVTGVGSIFISYFMSGPAREYRDLLRNDADLFTGYRLRQIDHGVLEVPLNLKRSNISYAHTEADVDLLLDTTHHAVGQELSART
ncbi:aspartate aminotransferase family protein [Pseudactinotalea sp.]|uniref:aspartate aminotransferase family protein n=1 Tax=Pseudactinotalea sp. TaxID=1926260 RepID=UPI003B3BDACD